MLRRIRELSRLPRRRVILFLWLYLMVAAQVLYLGLSDLPQHLVLMLLITAGLISSYSLPARLEGLVLRLMDVAAIFITLYYGWVIYRDPSIWGTQLGYALGFLWALLTFGVFSTRLIQWVIWVGLVFAIFSAISSFDLKFMVVVPLQLGLMLATLLELRTAELESIAGRTRSPAPRPFTTPRILTTLKVSLAATLVVVALGTGAYLAFPRPAGPPQTNIRLPRGNKLDAPSQTDLPAGESKQEKDDRREQARLIGFSDSLELTGSGRLRADPTPVMVVRSSRNGYLRAAVFDYYTGTGWKKSSKLREAIAPAVDDEPLGGRSFYLPLVDFPSRTYAKENLVPRGIYVDNLPSERGSFYIQRRGYEHRFSDGVVVDRLDFQLVNQQIEFLRPNEPYFFAYAQPAIITDISRLSRAAEAGLYAEPMVDQLGQVRALLQAGGDELPAKFTYSVVSVVPNIREEWLSTSPPILNPQNFFLNHYTQLPDGSRPGEVPVSEAFIRFAQNIATKNDAVTVYEKVKNIYNFLVRDGGFTYTLDYPGVPEGKEASEFFVFESKRGFCQFYASTMAVMLRANNIPARVVSGYNPGEYSLLYNGYLIRSSNAHTWVEVYFNGYGWIPFDPTPTSADIFNEKPLTKTWRNIIDLLRNLFLVDPYTVRSALAEVFGAWWGKVVAFLRPNLTLLALAGLTMLFAGLGFVLYSRRRRRLGHLPSTPLGRALLELTRALEPWHRQPPDRLTPLEAVELARPALDPALADGLAQAVRQAYLCLYAPPAASPSSPAPVLRRLQQLIHQLRTNPPAGQTR